MAGGGSTSTTSVAPATTPTTKPGGSTTPTTSGGGSQTVTSPSSKLAFTGVGPGVGALGILGGVLILMGLALLVLVDAARRAMAQFAAIGPTTWRRIRSSNGRDSSAHNRQPVHAAIRIATRTSRWFLGR